MKRFLTTLCCVCVVIASAQKQDCSPHRGSPKVCDSIYRLCYDDAYAILNVQVQNKKDKDYDSLFLSQARIEKYTQALMCMYNGLEDSLADFRQHLHMGTVLHPDSNYRITIIVPHGEQKPVYTAGMNCGIREIDELTNQAGMILQSIQSNDSVYELIYTTPPLVNVYCFTRRIFAINNKYRVASSFGHYGNCLISIYEEGNTSYVTLTENFACMPPEWPCEFINRTFSCQPGAYFRYEKFERGVYPWPDLPEDR